MSLEAKTAARPASTPAPARLARLRRGSLAVLVLVVAEYLIAMYVNLFVTIPRADHGHSVGSAIANLLIRLDRRPGESHPSPAGARSGRPASRSNRRSAARVSQAAAAA